MEVDVELNPGPTSEQTCNTLCSSSRMNPASPPETIEQFIESNIEHSWQDYLERMSNQGTWADAIIIQHEIRV